MIAASCHCGAVRLEVEVAPEELLECNCSICRRYGTLWAYYSPKQVRFLGDESATQIYLRGERKLEFHHCKTCGCTTHWAPVDKARDRMGVNARLMEPSAVAGIRVRHFDGADTWTMLD